MMSMQKRKRYALSALAGLLVFCAGVLVGQVDKPMPEKEALMVFAESMDSDLATPEPEEQKEMMENWFALEVISQETGEVETLPPDESTLAPTPEATIAPGFQIELVREEGEDEPQSRAKRVLIYHTHTFEAYEQTKEEPYKETQQWRTEDSVHNIVSVGESLAALLRGMGVEVVHDVTAFEPPDLNTSYSRSLEMLEKRRDMGESYDLYIDLHRDAYVASQVGPNTITIGDTPVARLMMLIGKGEGQTGEGFEEKPAWEENLAIAQRMTNELNAELSGICKDVRMKSGRFNQHIAVGCLLIEVGNNRNTLAEAKAAMPYLADAICAVFADMK